MNKKLESVGVAGGEFLTAQDAASHTYMRRDGSMPPTPLMFVDNPFNEAVYNSRLILEIGCGTGRNLSWIMNNLRADYVGIEPNPSMRRAFWEIQNHDWKPRTVLLGSFEYLPPSDWADVVLCTFVFQHIGYRVNPDQMNITDITLRSETSYCVVGII